MNAVIKVIVFDNCISKWLDDNNKKEVEIEEVAQYFADINIYKKTVGATPIKKLKQDITTFYKNNQIHQFKRVEILKVEGNNNWIIKRKQE